MKKLNIDSQCSQWKFVCDGEHQIFYMGYTLSGNCYQDFIGTEIYDQNVGHSARQNRTHAE